MFTWANSIGFCSNNPPADGDTIAEGVIEEPEPIPDGEDFCSSDGDTIAEGVIEEPEPIPDGEDFCSSDDPTSIPDSLNPIQLEIQ